LVLPQIMAQLTSCRLNQAQLDVREAHEAVLGSLTGREDAP